MNCCKTCWGKFSGTVPYVYCIIFELKRGQIAIAGGRAGVCTVHHVEGRQQLRPHLPPMCPAGLVPHPRAHLQQRAALIVDKAGFHDITCGYFAVHYVLYLCRKCFYVQVSVGDLKQFTFSHLEHYSRHCMTIVGRQTSMSRSLFVN